MTRPRIRTHFQPVVLSLADLLGTDYVDAACAAACFLSGKALSLWTTLAYRPLDFYPQAFQRQLISLLPHVGTRCVAPLKRAARGATSAAFQAHAHLDAAPIGALGYYRMGKNGRLYLTTKSEHYHLALGHGFPGYKLMEPARRLGIPNATHNNTRGPITRLLEEDLIRAAKIPTVLDRVLNLETGSLAVEAVLKMALARFYKSESGARKPKYAGRVPVIGVVFDEDGGSSANYHGTTVLTQWMRGMWPGLLDAIQDHNLLLIRGTRLDDMHSLEALFETFNAPPYKMAAFVHELVLMNYGGRALSEPFVRRAHALCKKHDVPGIVDEIQTGLWSPELFMFREYGVSPAAAVIGKGFPGGEYAASRVLFSAALDTLPQFGALVTNGQEELASLAYLITMRWAEANAEVTRTIGDYYQERLREFPRRYPNVVAAVEGRRHLAGIYFHNLVIARTFADRLNTRGLDISAQTYKPGCPPSTLTKLPLIMDYDAVDAVLDKMNAVLRALDKEWRSKHPC